MPAFTFEKISPPDRGSNAPPMPQGDNQRRGTIIQVLGRFVEARTQSPERHGGQVRRDEPPGK